MNGRYNQSIGSHIDTVGSLCPSLSQSHPRKSATLVQLSKLKCRSRFANPVGGRSTTVLCFRRGLRGKTAGPRDVQPATHVGVNPSTPDPKASTVSSIVSGGLLGVGIGLTIITAWSVLSSVLNTKRGTNKRPDTKAAEEKPAVEVKQKHDEQQATAAQLTELAGAVETLRQQLAAGEQARAALEAQVVGSSGELGRVREQKEALEGQVAGLRGELGNAEQQLRGAQDRAGGLAASVAALQERSQSLEARVRDMEALEAEARLQDAVRQAGTPRTKVSDLHQLVHARTLEVRDAATQLGLLEHSLGSLSPGCGGATSWQPPGAVHGYTLEPGGDASGPAVLLREALSRARARLEAKQGELRASKEELTRVEEQLMSEGVRSDAEAAQQHAAAEQERAALQAALSSAQAEAAEVRQQLADMQRRLDAQQQQQEQRSNIVPAQQPQQPRPASPPRRSGPEVRVQKRGSSSSSSSSAVAAAPRQGAVLTPSTSTLANFDPLQASLHTLGLQQKQALEARLQRDLERAAGEVRVRQAAGAARLDPRARTTEAQLLADVQRLEAELAEAGTSASQEEQDSIVEELEHQRATLHKLYASQLGPGEVRAMEELQAGMERMRRRLQEVRDSMPPPSPREDSGSQGTDGPAAQVPEEAATSKLDFAQRMQRIEAVMNDPKASVQQVQQELINLKQLQAEMSQQDAPSSKQEELSKGAKVAAAATPAASSSAVDSRAAVAGGVPDDVAFLAEQLWETLEPELTASPSPPMLQRDGLPPLGLHPNAPLPRGDAPAGELRLFAGGAAVPHPSKAATGGEDAFFLSGMGLGAVGVADGVGSWGQQGVDPSQYSRSLMRECEAAVADGALNPREALEAAHRVVGDTPGSCTACVAQLGPGGLLHVANLGDSGFRLVRDGACCLASKPQMHDFNMPFQLASPSVLEDTDWPEDAEGYEQAVEPGDTLLLATDGLFDNMWDDELAGLVAEHLQKSERRDEASAKELAQTIAARAAANAFNKELKLPWAVHKAEAGKGPLWNRMFPRGGKPDDCTVVVAFVQPVEAPVLAPAKPKANSTHKLAPAASAAWA